jgi:hypothetical protein
MLLLIQKADYADSYRQWLLASDPDAFRRDLPHNQQFRQQARERGIALKTWFAGVNDTGLLLDFSSGLSANEKHPWLGQEICSVARQLETTVAEATELEQTEVRRQRQATRRQLGANWRAYQGLFDADLLDDRRGFQPVHQATGQPLNVQQIYDHTRPYYARLDLLWHLAASVSSFLEQRPLPVERRAKVTKQPRGPPRQTLAASPADQDYEALRTKAQTLENHVNGLNETYRRTEDDDAHIPNLQRLARHGPLRYHFRREPANPANVLFGNDASCCLSLRDEITAWNRGLTALLLDEATTCFGIYQGSADRPARRVGLVLTLAAQAQDGRPVLIANSIELSPFKSPLTPTAYGALVRHTLGYLNDFAGQAGFTRLGLGNTAENPAPDSVLPWLKEPKRPEGLTKLPIGAQLDYHQDVFQRDKQGYYRVEPPDPSWAPAWFWVLPSSPG